MTTRSQRYFWIVLLAVFAITLAACAPAITPTPTETFVPTAIFTFVPPTIIPATVMPTQAPPPIFTPDSIQVERWMEYQTELARVLYSYDANHLEGYDPERYKDAICEWDILGQLDQEVYVWAECSSANGLAIWGNPVVIYLKPDGSIREVNVARAGADPRTQFAVYDLHLFPIDIQEKFCLYYFFGIVPQCGSIISNQLPGGLSIREDALISHLEYRKDHAGEPPLVVLSTMPTATPIPIIPTPPLIFMITPDTIQVKRWIEYQTALAQKLFPPAIRAQGKVLCEWEILAQADQEVYVWAACMVLPVEDSYPPILNVMSSIVHLDSDGAIQNIEIPDDNNYLSDFKQIFPEYVYKMSTGGSRAANEEGLISHLHWRFLYPEEPPLIVLSAIMPTTTPNP